MRKLTRDGLIVVAITFALLATTEIALRQLFRWRDSSRPAAAPAATYQHNADYLIALAPNLRSTLIRAREDGGNVVTWETNGQSFRGSELREHPDLRVIVYGDSNVHAVFSNLEDTFPVRLESHLTKLVHKDIEVINSGVTGFGPDQSLLKLSKEIDIYLPDIVVFQIFADNDFGDLVRNRLFDLKGDGTLVATNFKREVDPLLAASQSIRAERSFLPSLSLVRAAHAVAGRIYTPRKRKSAPQISDLLALADQEFAVYRKSGPLKFSHFADHYDIDVAIHPDLESSRVKTRVMEAVLLETMKVTKAKNVKLLVVIEPSPTDLTQYFTFSYNDLQTFSGYRPDNLSRFVDEICARNNIDRIDLYGVFIANTPGDLYFRGNSHWNDRGQDLAARVTAERLAAEIGGLDFAASNENRRRQRENRN